MNPARAIFSLLIVICLPVLYSCNNEKQERTDLSAGGSVNDAISFDDLKDAVMEHIEIESGRNEGYYRSTDPITIKKLDLTFQKFNDRRLLKTSEDMYFACVDFISTDGIIYDIDILMQLDDDLNLIPSSTYVHRRNGGLRYTWEYNGKYWQHKALPQQQ
ncbi:MAG: hypothetical protein IIA45_12255 [Bacteroidetes bacterium]|nr:hypothetical protein [Bacteroidota bacterium]